MRPWIWILCLFLGPLTSSIAAGQYFSVVVSFTCFNCCNFPYSISANYDYTTSRNRVSEHLRTVFTDQYEGQPWTAVRTTCFYNFGPKGQERSRKHQQLNHGRPQCVRIGESIFATSSVTRWVHSQTVYSHLTVLLVVFFMPLQIALSITFLYSILGWR